MKLDILCIVAHPDDAELAIGGTIIKQIELGYKVGVIDLTQGELGTRGNAEIRKIEAENASKILGINIRKNLKLKDGFFEINEQSLLKIIHEIRLYQPTIVITNAETDRHSDHGRATMLVDQACFLSGLEKINTKQDPWRPKKVFHAIQDYYTYPSIVVDITKYYSKKLQSIMAFSSQFYNPNSIEPNTPISGKDFIDFIESRAREMGRIIGVEFGEGFTCKTALPCKNLLEI